LNILTSDLSPFVIDSTSSILEAAFLIDANTKKSIVVLKSGFFYGVVSDGDLRRSILHNVPPCVSLSTLVNRNPICLRNIDSPSCINNELVNKLFDNYPWISLMPVVNSDDRLIAIAFRF